MSLAEFAREHGLKRVGARPAFLDYLAQAWQRRDFAITMSVYANQAANAKNRLGRWWNILLPTIQALVYGLIFGVLMGSNRPDNFIPFLLTGVFLFSYISGSMTSGATSVTGNTGLVRSLSFPRVLLPISAVIRQFLNALPQIALLMVSLVVFGQGITWKWLLMIPVLLLFTMFNLGVAMIIARLTVHIIDINKLLPFVVRVLFYTSGIFFHLDTVLRPWPTALALLQYNPIYDLIQLSRGLLIVGHSDTPFLWLTSIGWSVGLLLIGVFFFWKAEERYGRED